MKAKQNYSVLMSVYHADNPDWLRVSIKSILDQTIPTDDFVIVCDGPLSEGLNQVLDEYSEVNNCIHVFRLKKNVGLGNALAFGIKCCKNELVARMDADDISAIICKLLYNCHVYQVLVHFNTKHCIV